MRSSTTEAAPIEHAVEREPRGTAPRAEAAIPRRARFSPAESGAGTEGPFESDLADARGAVAAG